MTVRELKALLQKLPPDCDELNVILCSAQGGETGHDLLVGTGYLELGDKTIIALIGYREIQRRVKAGLMEKPEGYIELPESEDPGEAWKKG